MSVSQVRHKGPQPSFAWVDAAHTSVLAAYGEDKQLVHYTEGHQPGGLSQIEEDRDHHPRNWRSGSAPV